MGYKLIQFSELSNTATSPHRRIGSRRRIRNIPPCNVSKRRLVSGPSARPCVRHCEFDSLSAWNRRVVVFEGIMVSTDHVRHELLAQLGRAATQGRIDVLINSGELCRSISNGNSSSVACCDAMQGEFKLGDTVLLDRSNGAGNDGPLSSAANHRDSDQPSAQIKLGHCGFSAFPRLQ
jgi:hypothetical protein